MPYAPLPTITEPPVASAFTLLASDQPATRRGVAEHLYATATPSPARPHVTAKTDGLAAL